MRIAECGFTTAKCDHTMVLSRFRRSVRFNTIAPEGLGQKPSEFIERATIGTRCAGEQIFKGWT